MKVLWLDCFAGMAGDMFAAALLDLGASEERWQAAMDALDLPDVDLSLHAVQKRGIRAKKLDVDHTEHHPHRGLSDVLEVAARAGLSAAGFARVEAIFTRLAEAEAAVHDTTVEEVHFHEVGAVDAIVDVVSAAVLLDDLAPDRVIASPVRTGYGSVRCAHGLMPVPAPATARMLEGIAAFGGEEEGEFLTPTGAAILATQVDDFGPLPGMRLERMGAGAGTREAPFPNAVRAFFGEAAPQAAGASLPRLLEDAVEERLVEVEAHVDDMDGEALADLKRRLLGGVALDVALVPVLAKKDRPGFLVRALGPAGSEHELLDALFVHSTTLGARAREERRVRLVRDDVEVDTALGPVRAKRTRYAGRERLRPEHDDLARLADEHGVSLEEAREAFFTATRLPA